MLYKLVKADSNVTRKKNFPWKFEAITATVVPPVDLIVAICFFELRRLGLTDVFVISLVTAFFMTKAGIYRKKENIQIPFIFYLPALSALIIFIHKRTRIVQNVKISSHIDYISFRACLPVVILTHPVTGSHRWSDVHSHFRPQFSP